MQQELWFSPAALPSPPIISWMIWSPVLHFFMVANTKNCFSRREISPIQYWSTSNGWEGHYLPCSISTRQMGEAVSFREPGLCERHRKKGTMPKICICWRAQYIAPLWAGQDRQHMNPCDSSFPLVYLSVSSMAQRTLCVYLYTKRSLLGTVVFGCLAQAPKREQGYRLICWIGIFHFSARLLGDLGWFTAISPLTTSGSVKLSCLTLNGV